MNNQNSGRSGGVRTFLRAEQTHPTELKEDIDIGILGVPYDYGASRKPGARYGPSGVREQMVGEYHFRVNSNEDYVSFPSETKRNYSDIKVRDCGDAPIDPKSATETTKKVSEYVEQIASKTIPIIVGGDHYITYPSFIGYANSIEQDVGLIHLDAHTDTSDEDDLYGRHFHGSPMARINDSKYGSYNTHAMVGIRGRAGSEFLDIREQYDLYVDYAEEVKEKGIEDSIQGAIDHVISKVDHVYLTVDIDVVDPGFAPGTGTPTFNGLTSGQLIKAMEILGNCSAIGAADMMEVAPDLDPTDTTSLLAARAIERYLQSKMSDSSK